MSSLAVEEVASVHGAAATDDAGIGLVVSVFEVTSKDMMENGIPSRAFLEREEEFDIIEAPYFELDEDDGGDGTAPNNSKQTMKKGILCTRSTDETYLAKWGSDRFDEHYRKYGIDTIWGWKEDSGLRPCAVYLRHCYLAAKSMGEVCYNSFLDETFLVDRKTTIRQYLEQYPQVLDQEPPPHLASRYCG